MSNIRTTGIDVLTDNTTPTLFVIDPFKISLSAARDRLDALVELEIKRLIISSTDDEDYHKLGDFLSGIKESFPYAVFEHFRPVAPYGYRRTGKNNWVLMTRVAGSAISYYEQCTTICGDNIAEMEPEDLQQRYRCLRALAFVFGEDKKSHTYVGAQGISTAIDKGVDVQLRNGIAHNDLYYLFSRNVCLEYGTVSKVRRIVGETFPLIVSGCIDRPERVLGALSAGATAVAIGSLLERPDWIGHLRQCVSAGRRWALSRDRLRSEELT
jgi:hypothetical protein